MSEATLNLVSREALELHFEGVTYGPIEHTQALGVLLFALCPARVRCATTEGPFLQAMRRVVDAAQGTADLLCSWADEPDVAEIMGDPRQAHLSAWVDAGCRAAPAPHADALRARLKDRLGQLPWPRVLH